MALDPIWKQQLTLVTYGNEFLTQNLNFKQWINHAIFNQHYFSFRDLHSQHLLAQHFQTWLEGLKKQGVNRISLHHSSILVDEKNPNANVELLPYTHFIVSHHAKKKVAWICGKELAEWYSAEDDYVAPEAQRINSRIETMWRYELNHSHAKRIENDLQAPNWQDIQAYTERELFDHVFAQGLATSNPIGQLYYGYEVQTPNDLEVNSSSQQLALIPHNYDASYAHKTLIRLDALKQQLDDKIKQPFNQDGDALAADQVMNLRRFRQKLEDLTAKFISKVANHYQTAQLLATDHDSPFDEPATNTLIERKKMTETISNKTNQKPSKSAKSSVFTLILITVIICICAYYFGL